MRFQISDFPCLEVCARTERSVDVTGYRIRFAEAETDPVIPVEATTAGQISYPPFLPEIFPVLGQ